MSALRMHERDQAAWIRRRHGSPPRPMSRQNTGAPSLALADSCSPLSGALSGAFGSKTGTTVNPAAAGQNRPVARKSRFSG